MRTVIGRMTGIARSSLRCGQWLAMAMATASAVLVSACEMATSPSDRIDVVDGRGTVVIDPGLALPSLRQLDREGLQLELVVNGTQVDTSRDTDGRWTAVIEVPRGVQLNLQSTIGLDGLLLARSIQQAPVSLDADEVQIGISADSYNSNFDADNDRLSNLFELENNTNPLDSRDPGLEVDEADIRLRFDLPIALESVDPGVTGQARLEASLNGETIELMAADDGFVADASVVADSRVYVEATWFLDNPSALAIAGIRRSDTASNGATINYESDSYRTRFDDDLDGVENAVEVRLQSDPTDAASRPGTSLATGQPETPDEQPSGSTGEEATPEPTPEQPPETPADDDAASACAVSVFTEGCDTDFDRDGIPDSVEGSEDDADEDSIPDWMESSTLDLDNDGTSAQFDVNEEDPCSPDARSAVCVGLSSDADGDGKTDVEEGDADRDGDGKPDADESAVDDADDDGTPDEEDPDDSDPCIPLASRPFCE